MATTLENFLKGLQFGVFGQFGENLRFTDEKTGYISRFVRIISAGRTFNFEVTTDDELAKYEKLKGQWVYAVGTVGRRKGSVSATARIVSFVLQGQSGWKEPTEAEIFAGCVFSGVVRVSLKREGVYSGTSYRKIQVLTFGDIFEFSNVEMEMYENIPESSMIVVKGHTEPKLTSNGGDKVPEMFLVLDGYKLADSDASSGASARPAREAKSA